MNCTQCGAFINENKRFCTQCGARVESGREVSPYEITDEISNKQQVKVQKVTVEQEEREFRKIEKVETGIRLPKGIPSGMDKSNESIIPKQKVRYEVRGDSRQSEVNEEMWFGNSKGIVGFAELLVTLLAHPMTTGQALYSNFDKKVSCIYVAILITLSSCITYLSFQSISNKIANLFYDIFDYFFGYGMVQYFLGEIGVQVLMLALLSNILFIGCITGCIMGFYRGILKIDIEWIECIQLMMMPLVFSFFGKVILFAAALVGAKLIIVLGVILGILLGALIIIQFVNRLGISAKVVYTMPLIYLLAVFIKYFFVFQVVKGYL